MSVGKIAAGYRAVFDGWFQAQPGYAMEGDPYLERQGRAPEGDVVVTVCVRVRPVEQEGAWNMPVVLDTATGKAP